MPSKKKKYNSRFPPARIKKIMQTDDEIGKVAAAVPVLISKCLEMFLVSILQHTGEVTKAKRAKTMSTSHLKECIMKVSMFDFLKDVVANVSDMQNDDEPSTSAAYINEESKKTIRKRLIAMPTSGTKRTKLDTDNSSATSENEQTASGGEESNGEPNLDRSNVLKADAYSSQDVLKADVYSSQDLPVEHHDLRDRNESETAIDANIERKESFHIPLSDLISSDNDGQGSNPDNVVPIVSAEVAPVESNEMESAIDMSIKREPRCGVIVTNSSVVSASRISVTTVSSGESAHEVASPPARREVNGGLSHLPLHNVNVPPPIASPLNMPHLYQPMTRSPAPPLPGAPGFGVLPLDHKVPQGGMLSFLYSPYSGELPVPPSLAPMDKSGHQTASALNPALHFPYNPVSAHYERMAAVAGSHPFAPPPVPDRTADMSHAPRPSRDHPAKTEDDDDYDA